MVKKIAVVVLVVLALYLVILGILKNIFYPKKYEAYVEKYCKLYAVEPDLVYAIIKQESNFNEKAESFAGARGLMQVLPATAKEVAVELNGINEETLDLNDKETNIQIGIKYLSSLIKRYDGNIYIAITAYNAGLGNVDKWFKEEYETYDTYKKIIEKIEFEETRKYTTNVIKYYNMYKKIY